MSFLSKSLRRLEGKTSDYRRNRRRRRSLALLAECELFDRAWYVQTYPDVRDSGVDPVRHYLESGWREGRDPGPDFSTTAYLKGNSDVAALGVNPLLHYIEHGKFEGRGAPHQGTPFHATFSPEERYGPAAPCARFERPVTGAVKWTRAGRILSGELTTSISGLTVATFADAKQRRVFEQALQQLAWFSGKDTSAPDRLETSFGRALQLLDGWQTGGGIFRTRWLPGTSALVVRAIQYIDGRPVMVGEGCVERDLDCVDIAPRNPFFPILFLFTAAAGHFVGWWQLSFPALCRGGPYYPELVALRNDVETGTWHLTSADRQFACALFGFRTGDAARAVDGLSVSLDGADGSHLLFQPEYRRWLADVMRVCVCAADGSTTDREEYLATALNLSAESLPRHGKASLKLASDMIPTLSVLSMSASEAASEDLAGSIIVDSADSNLATRVRVPYGIPVRRFGNTTSLPALASRITGEGSAAPLMAIRLPPRRPVDEAELLMPGGSQKESAVVSSITWIISPDGWTETDLVHSLQSLRVQDAIEPAVLFVGTASNPIIDVANALFDRSVIVIEGATEIGSVIESDFAAYVGSGIILHDRRTAALLIKALETTEAMTATAVIVTADKRGKASHVKVDRDGLSANASLLPKAIVPIAAHSSDFWIARANALRCGVPTGNHVCSTHVAVSRVGSAKSKPPIVFPPARTGQFVTTETLVG